MTPKPRIRRRVRPTDAPSPTTAPEQTPASAPEACDVGYRNPPRTTRFKPGRSGNPRGRPKGAKNLKTIIERELNRKVVIRDDRGRRSVSKSEAVAMQLVKKALEGNDKAIQILLKLTNEFEAILKAAAEAEVATLSPEAMDEEDQAVLDEFTQRLRDEAFDLDLPELEPAEEPSDDGESGDGT